MGVKRVLTEQRFPRISKKRNLAVLYCCDIVKLSRQICCHHTKASLTLTTPHRTLFFKITQMFMCPHNAWQVVTLLMSLLFLVKHRSLAISVVFEQFFKKKTDTFKLYIATNEMLRAITWTASFHNVYYGLECVLFFLNENSTAEEHGVQDQYMTHLASFITQEDFHIKTKVKNSKVRLTTIHFATSAASSYI